MISSPNKRNAQTYVPCLGHIHKVFDLIKDTNIVYLTYLKT